ncbi:SHOCT domain-containing protein [Halocynthiibacter sp. C4]|uniref:SHOCT domain-containing protein n=1 Tax=Halocynthiibacter sp. C4 TaxID=2992758 RepID=UPI00237B13B2|nr:SHOCT domain-containing protein [Halocynthiibacter sp. C4]MDE0588316.1 SHOCT domain-containing protein [Halocynthiibacter sp. C4]
MQETIGFFDIIWSIFWLFLMVAWFWVMIGVVTDVFRSRDLNGFAKAAWVAFVILIPWLGVLCYVLIRGDKMNEHRAQTMAEIEDSQRDYIRSVAQVSAADELEKLGALKEKGVISEEEFNAQKAKILSA